MQTTINPEEASFPVRDEQILIKSLYVFVSGLWGVELIQGGRELWVFPLFSMSELTDPPSPSPQRLWAVCWSHRSHLQALPSPAVVPVAISDAGYVARPQAWRTECFPDGRKATHYIYSFKDVSMRMVSFTITTSQGTFVFVCLSFVFVKRAAIYMHMESKSCLFCCQETKTITKSVVLFTFLVQ